jgi:hypothetical protein
VTTDTSLRRRSPRLQRGRRSKGAADSQFSIDHELTIAHDLLLLQYAPFLTKVDTPKQATGDKAIKWIAEAVLELKRKGNSMAKKSACKSKRMIPGDGPKPAGMKQPHNGRAKMAGGKAKVGKKGR